MPAIIKTLRLQARVIRSYIIVLSVLLFTLSACKRDTPPEMLFGSWKITSVIENGHTVTHQYVDETTAYLKFDESGIYSIGLMDTSSIKTWMVYPESNELVFLNGAFVADIKKWAITASDNQINLTYEPRALTIILKRIKELPELTFKNSQDLVGKWIVEKVTINGTNSTRNYAFPDRWIILAENGRFYNGDNKDDTNVGYWKANESLTRIEFRVDKKEESPALSFYVANELIWYEKQRSENEQHAVRIYFKKEEG